MKKPTNRPSRGRDNLRPAVKPRETRSESGNFQVSLDAMDSAVAACKAALSSFDSNRTYRELKLTKSCYAAALLDSSHNVMTPLDCAILEFKSVELETMIFKLEARLEEQVQVTESISSLDGDLSPEPSC